MPKTLERTRKQIAKKRHGAIDALHEFSRDSKRLHKAQVRDDRLEKLIAARKKHDKPLSTSSVIETDGRLQLMSELCPSCESDLLPKGRPGESE